jgi:hypothetical protein
VFIRKKKHHNLGSDYYQLVESRRVDGQPRQKVVMHLGGHATVDDALREWPREVGRLRREGYGDYADELNSKLERLKKMRAEGTA